jgi:ABC-type nitrate/sulfonate/bicarbonate transport system substrate-binding protein
MRSMILLGVSIKHSVVAYLYMGTDLGFFVKEGIELKLVQIPGSLARKALLGRQVDGMEFGNEGTSGPAT